ncbi:hypothetical protein ZIOFF_015695 [Zingiber officinale]|uniref:Uncharacterized protein n=1 Tax=Zingiber officinale TaxID=94328 RepID=A0A8J5HEL2_ZINOF|nr:hypothetical protein ZIOFF_015695 [Zingiber officinale]
MGAQHSTRSHSLAVADAGAGGGDGHAHLPCLAELMSYEEACRLDPELETFDSMVQEITDCLLEMNQEVGKVILDCNHDVWKNAELFDLVEDYFQNSLQTLNFCTTLEKCLTKARDNQLILQVALQRFAEEEEDHKGDNERNSRTMTELRRFKATGDPFTEEFFKAFRSIHHQQLQMLDKMQMRKNKLDKKLKSIKAWRKVSSIIFAATLTTFLICSIVAAAIATPPVATAMVAATAIPIGSMGKYSKREDATNDMNTTIETGDLEGIEKYSKRTVKVTKQHNEDCKLHLRLMGVLTIEAPCEVEVQCAALCKSNKVLEELRLTIDQFIDLCILTGCDYCDSIKVEYGVSAATVPCLCYLDLI